MGGNALASASTVFLAIKTRAHAMVGRVEKGLLGDLGSELRLGRENEKVGMRR